MVTQYLNAFFRILETLLILSPLFVVVGLIVGIIICAFKGLVFLARNNIK